KITEHIVIGGDWNAHHPAWLDHNTDDVGECILDFIVPNGLHILNKMPFGYTFMKDNVTPNDVELDVRSDHLPITFNIKTMWSSPRIERQKIETWNLRSNKWEQFRLRFRRNIDNWMQSIDPIALDNTETLDKAVESWTKCIVEASEATIGIKTIWKGNKPWRSDSLSRLRKRVQKSRNLMLYKKTAKQLRRRLQLEKHQHMATQGIYSHSLKHIPKPDRDHSQCKNHRPIALLSNIGKLMERIITRRLIWWLNEKQLLHQTQAGFQSWHNTDELLLRLTETIHKHLIAIHVWRNGLRYKMRHEFQLDGDRLGRVVLNGTNSEWMQFNTG
ncbi:hypothetical protein RFI_37323, partial [Reticulomyxa filosa]